MKKQFIFLVSFLNNLCPFRTLENFQFIIKGGYSQLLDDYSTRIWTFDLKTDDHTWKGQLFLLYSILTEPTVIRTIFGRDKNSYKP